jgi:small neutral amino acid transporter SnatA (MarC family)
MNVGVLVLGFFGAWNVFRLHPALPDGERSRGERVAATGLGALVAGIAVTVIAAWADDLLDALDITPPTARIAVGAVVAIAGARDLLTAPPAPEPAMRGVGAAVVPIFFPFLFSPPAVLLALAGGADHDAGTVAWSAGAALLTLVVAAAIAPLADGSPEARVERGLHRLLAGALVLAGLALVIDGIFDI